MNPDAAAVDKFFADLPSWPEQLEEITDGANVIQMVRDPDDFLDYRCDSRPKTEIKSFDRIAAAGMDEDVIWPGALLQGGTLESGRPEPLNIPRSPVTMRVNVPITNQSRVVDAPNSVNSGQAIADLIRDIAEAQGELDPVRSNIDFRVTEASSFEQSMLSMGVGGKFKEPYSKIDVAGNIESSSDRAIRTHSAVIQLKQEMFTISFSDDLPSLDTTSELFANSLTVPDLEALRDEGAVGDDNLPVYVKSVTYGRLLLASIKSTNVESGEKLAGSLGASYDSYGANGEFNDEQREILENSTWQYEIFGGSQEAADNAIGSLDWAQYFTPTSATTAVPLSFELRTVNDRAPAGIQDTVEYEMRGNCEPPRAYRVTMALWSVFLKAGNCIIGAAPCWYRAWAIRDTGNPPLARNVIHVGTISNSFPNPNPNDSVSFDLVDHDKFWTYSAYQSTATSIPVASADSPYFTYPFPKLVNGVKTRYPVTVAATFTDRQFVFSYDLTKEALY